MSNSKDTQVLQCIGCGKSFALSGSARRFFAERDLSIPKRCPKCRAERRSGPRLEVYAR